jgi:hypothetical protein
MGTNEQGLVEAKNEPRERGEDRQELDVLLALAASELARKKRVTMDDSTSKAKTQSGGSHDTDIIEARGD